MENQPTLAEWKKLYELMIELKSLEPWEWMLEQDIFGVENPETGEIGFVSVMGFNGEHYSVAVYRGEEGLKKFWNFQAQVGEEDNGSSFQELLEIPQLQASFEDRNYLYEQDREIIKKLGLTFRGRQAWPTFRSYMPGFAPWFISLSEARFLILALQQTLEVAPRVLENPELLAPNDANTYLLRKMTKTGGSSRWQDTVWKEPLPKPEHYNLAMDMIALERFKSLPASNVTYEIDVFMTPQAVLEKNARPYYPYLILMLETKRGLIVGQDVITPQPDLKSMWENVPKRILSMLVKSGTRPAHILTSCHLLSQLLEQAGEEAHLSVQYVKELPLTKETKAEFLEFMQR